MNKKIIQRILLVAVSKNYLKNTMLIAMRYLKNILLVAVSKNYLKNTILIFMRLFKEYIISYSK